MNLQARVKTDNGEKIYLHCSRDPNREGYCFKVESLWTADNDKGDTLPHITVQGKHIALGDILEAKQLKNLLRTRNVNALQTYGSEPTRPSVVSWIKDLWRRHL